MGLTLIRKSDSTRPLRDPKVALVLAGGAVSGGAFKVGGLKALNDFFVGRKITDLDIYVGLSAGSILGVVARRRRHARRDDQGARRHEHAARSAAAVRLLPARTTREFVTRPAKFCVRPSPRICRASRVDFARGLPGLPTAVGRAAARVPDAPQLHALRGVAHAADRAHLAEARDPGADEPHPERLLRQRAASSAGCAAASSASGCRTTSAPSSASPATAST